MSALKSANDPKRTCLKLSAKGSRYLSLAGSFATGGMIGATSDYGIVLKSWLTGCVGAPNFSSWLLATHQTKENHYGQSKRNH